MVSLYADDLLIYLSDPAKSVPRLLNYISAFSEISGYTINWTKSVFVSFYTHTHTHKNSSQFNSLLFKIVKDHFTYIGLVISKNPKHIFKLNFLALSDKLKDHVDHWRLLPLSMIGKINTIKIVILPEFPNLFQNLCILLAEGCSWRIFF